MNKSKKQNKHFLYSVEGLKYLQDEYTTGKQSAVDIAKNYGTYANFIYRALRYHGIPRKDRSEVQKLLLSSGKKAHPTAGKEREPEVKRKIGTGVYKRNLKMSEEERQARIDKCRKNWYAKSEKTRKEYTDKSHKKTRIAGQLGSKFEKHIVAALLAHKFKLQIHHKMNFADSEMTIDIFMPHEGIVIEVDGPMHFAPIFGEKTLDEQIDRDLKKNQLLLSEGYAVIRIQNPKGYISTSFVEDFMDRFIPYIKEVAKAPKNKLYNILVEEF